MPTIENISGTNLVKNPSTSKESTLKKASSMEKGDNKPTKVGVLDQYFKEKKEFDNLTPAQKSKMFCNPHELPPVASTSSFPVLRQVADPRQIDFEAITSYEHENIPHAPYVTQQPYLVDEHGNPHPYNQLDESGRPLAIQQVGMMEEEQRAYQDHLLIQQMAQLRHEDITPQEEATLKADHLVFQENLRKMRGTGPPSDFVQEPHLVDEQGINHPYNPVDEYGRPLTAQEAAMMEEERLALQESKLARESAKQTPQSGSLLNRRKQLQGKKSTMEKIRDLPRPARQLPLRQKLKQGFQEITVKQEPIIKNKIIFPPEELQSVQMPIPVMSELPAGSSEVVYSGQLPPGYDEFSAYYPPGMCQGDFPHGMHPTQLPPGIHPSQLFLGMDPRQLQEGMHEHQFNPGYCEQEPLNPMDYAPGHLPAEFYESQGLIPPGEVGYFNAPEKECYPGMPIDEHYVLGPTGIPMSREAFQAYEKQEIKEKETRAAEWRKRDALVKNGGRLEPINLSKARKSNKKSKSKGTKSKNGNDQSSQAEKMDTSNLPPGTLPNHLPPNRHPIQLPPGVHPNQLHCSQFVPGMHPRQLQQGMHEHQLHAGYYEQEPFNPMDHAHGHLPAEFYESQGLVPPDEVGYFNPPEEIYYPGMPIDEHYVLGPTGIPMSREAFEAYEKDEIKLRETRRAEWEKRKALEKNGGRLEPIHLSTARKSKKKLKRTKPKNSKDQPSPVTGLSPELIADMSPEKKSLWDAINKTLDDNFGPLTPQNMEPRKALKDVLQVPKPEGTKDERFTNLMNNLVDPGLKSSREKFNALVASKTKDEVPKQFEEALPTSKSKSSQSDLTEEQKVIPPERGSVWNASLEEKFGPLSAPRLARAPLKANWEPPNTNARAVKPAALCDNLSPLSPPGLGKTPLKVNSELPTNSEKAVKQTNLDDNFNPSTPVGFGCTPLKANWKPAIASENTVKPTPLGDNLGTLSATSSGDVSLKPNWKLPSDDDVDQEKPKTSKYLKSKKALNDLLKPAEVKKEPVSKSQQAITDRLAHLFKKKTIVKSSPNIEPLEQFLDNPQPPSSQSKTANQVEQIEEQSSKPILNFMKSSSRKEPGEQGANKPRPQSPSKQPKTSDNDQPEEKNPKSVFTLGGISPLPDIETDISNHSLQEVKVGSPLKSNKVKLEPLSPSRPKELKLKNKSSTTKSPDTKHKEAHIPEEKVPKNSKHSKELRKQKKKKPAPKKRVYDEAGNTSDDSYPSLNDPCYDI